MDEENVRCGCAWTCARAWSGRECDYLCMCFWLCVGECAVHKCMHVTKSVSSAVGRPVGW